MRSFTRDKINQDFVCAKQKIESIVVLSFCGLFSMRIFPSFIAIHLTESQSLSFGSLNILDGTVVLCLYFLTVTFVSSI
jgi:hypothetical protein